MPPFGGRRARRPAPRALSAFRSRSSVSVAFLSPPGLASALSLASLSPCRGCVLPPCPAAFRFLALRPAVRPSSGGRSVGVLVALSFSCAPLACSSGGVSPRSASGPPSAPLPPPVFGAPRGFVFVLFVSRGVLLCVAVSRPWWVARFARRGGVSATHIPPPLLSLIADLARISHFTTGRPAGSPAGILSAPQAVGGCASSPAPLCGRSAAGCAAPPLPAGGAYAVPSVRPSVRPVYSFVNVRIREPELFTFVNGRVFTFLNFLSAGYVTPL